MDVGVCLFLDWPRLALSSLLVSERQWGLGKGI